MKKRVLVVAGVAIGLAALVGLSLFAGLNVVRAAARAGQSLALGGPRHILSAQGQVTPTEKGAVVVLVDADSPAAKAGVKRGDILLKIDDQDVNTPADLKSYLAGKKAGDQVKLTVQHGDDQRALTATLVDRNGTPYLGLSPFGMGGGRGGMGKGFGPGMTITGTKVFTEVVVTEVITGSPAEKAGLKQGDFILSVDGKSISPDNDLSTAIAAHKPGDQVTLSVRHASDTTASDVKVTLGNNPDKQGAAYLGVRYTFGPRMSMRIDGNGMMPFDRGGRGNGFPGMPFTNTVSGAIIHDVTAGSPAEKAGLKQGDIITAIDGKTLQSPQELVDAIAAHKPGEQITLKVQHQNDTTATDVKVTLGDNPNKKGTAYLGVSVGGFMRFNRQPGAQGGNGSQGGFFFGPPQQQQKPQAPAGSTL